MMLFTFFILIASTEAFNMTFREYLDMFPNSVINRLSEKHFIQNIEYIVEHNRMNHGYELGLTPFLHMSEDEWKSRFTTFEIDKQEGEEFETLNLRGSAPSSWSWVEQGMTTPVKDQKIFGTCYEHAAVETMETAWVIKSGERKVLSVQQGVDCSKLNHGVNGGLPDYSYKYAMNTEKCLESDYPYTGNGECHSCTGAVSKLSKYVDVKDGDEDSMGQAILINSLSIGIKADDKQFQMYKSGVLSYDCDSSSKTIDHAVVIEGYGVENGKSYWLVRNSWGTEWGDKGYIKMERGVCMCGLCHMSSYPVF